MGVGDCPELGGQRKTTKARHEDKDEQVGLPEGPQFL